MYSLNVQFYKDSVNNYIGQVFKFGINGGDNESGKNWFGNNNFGNINDKDTVAVISSQFGEINPLYFRFWDFDNQTTKTTNVIICFPQMPLQNNLSQNYPNPFNPSTLINYQLPMNNLVTLKVFDIVGREVATLVNERQEAGMYQTAFNAQGLSSGLYFYQLRAGNYSEVKKMILMK